MTQPTIDDLAGRAAEAWTLSETLRRLRDRDNAREDWGKVTGTTEPTSPDPWAVRERETLLGVGVDLAAAHTWFVDAMAERDVPPHVASELWGRRSRPADPGSSNADYRPDSVVAGAWAHLDAEKRLRELWSHLLAPGDDPARAERLAGWLAERLPDEGAAEVDDLRPPEWFTDATGRGARGSITAGALRKARGRGDLPSAEQRGNRWLYSIAEVAERWPEHAGAIRRADEGGQQGGQARTMTDRLDP